jgi:choline dehydrogenase-like flavoprotein
VLLGAGDMDWPDALAPGAHPMGTTRMHEDPRRGVVDAQCRVHGIAKPWVAGSSDVPTSDAAAPTLTVAAFALHLADALAEWFR